ncbi:tubulin-folding cofactor B [Acrasis kona]|uniref:Tubulin-folding cofactor B n=1 Tax=Acrasis kona TaxID=1008807 RepID=A0AAW2Z7A0_9EUKA
MWLEITHSVIELRTEKQYDPAITIDNLKSKLYSIVGTSPSHMRLELYDQYGALVATMTDDSRTLESYGALNHMRVHVVDTDPSNKMAALTDVSSVQKYTISEEDYDKKEDTFRKWKQRNIAPTDAEQKKEEEEKFYSNKELISSIKVGDRFEKLDETKARGEVKYVGKTQFSAGYWVGVQYDEPLGKHNGTVKGAKYFECTSGYGMFLRPDKIQTGNYPEVGFDDLEEDEI